MPIICRPYITLPNGVVIWAKERGKKAFCFFVDEILPKNKISDPLKKVAD